MSVTPSDTEQKIPDYQGRPVGTLAVTIKRWIDFNQIQTGYGRVLPRLTDRCEYFPTGQTRRVRCTDTGDVCLTDYVGIDTDIGLTAGHANAVAFADQLLRQTPANSFTPVYDPTTPDDKSQVRATDGLRLGTQAYIPPGPKRLGRMLQSLPEGAATVPTTVYQMADIEMRVAIDHATRLPSLQITQDMPPGCFMPATKQDRNCSTPQAEAHYFGQVFL